MIHPKNDLGFLLHDVARLMRKRFERHARALGLTRAQCQVLAYLARHDGTPQGALADILEMEPITLTRLVDRLEKSGLVERRSHPADRRVRVLWLADAGYPKLAGIAAVGAATRREAMQGLDQEEHDLLFAILSVMRANLAGKPGAE
jgi:MarR family transcriptional regulator for hemolysin